MEKSFKDSDAAKSLQKAQSRFERASQRVESMRQQCEKIGNAVSAANELSEVLKNLGLEGGHNIALVLRKSIYRAGEKTSMKYGVAENHRNAIEREIAAKVTDMLKVVGASKGCLDEALSCSDEIPY
jgi:hypothetical protein